MSTPIDRVHRGMTTREPIGFDAFTQTVATTGTRRGLLRFVAALPLSVGLAALLDEESEAGREHRRSAQHHHQTGDATEHRTGQRKGQQVSAAKKKKCAQAGQTRKKGTRPKCCAGLVTDASGRCAASPSSQPSPPPGRSCTGLKPTDDLQAAIDAAEDKATLTLCAGTWRLSETVVIGKALTLIGAGAGQSILDGGRPLSGPGGVRVLQIDPLAEVTLQDLTITKGQAAGEYFPEDSGGGIFSERATLTLSGVSVSDNTAIRGGGIYTNGGTVTLQANSHVSDNTATFHGGGVFNRVGTVTLQANSHVSGNTAKTGGGGIFDYVGTVTLQANSRVSDNTADRGGGIDIYGGSVTLQADSRVTGNTAGEEGGGIYNNSGTVTIAPSALVCNNTPSGNQCVGVASCPTADGICPV